MTKFIIHINHMAENNKLLYKMFLNKNDKFYKSHQQDVILIASIYTDSSNEYRYKLKIYSPSLENTYEESSQKKLYEVIQEIYKSFNIKETYAYVEANLSMPSEVEITYIATLNIKSLLQLKNLKYIKLFTETEALIKQKSDILQANNHKDLEIILTKEVAPEYSAKLTNKSESTSVPEPVQIKSDVTFAKPEKSRNLWSCLFFCQNSAVQVSDSLEIENYLKQAL